MLSCLQWAQLSTVCGKIKFFALTITDNNNLIRLSSFTGFSLSRRWHLRCLLLQSFRFPLHLSLGYLHIYGKTDKLVKCRCNINVICLPTEHQGVHKNSFRNVRAFQDRIGIWKSGFLRRGENRSTRRKTSRSREENQQQTQPTLLQ